MTRQEAKVVSAGHLRHRLRAVARRPGAAIGLGVMILLVLLAIAAVTGLLGHDPITQNPTARFAPPSLTHLMGTDQLGRDVFVRSAAGLATTTLVAVTAVGAACLVGTAAGVAAGYLGRMTDLAVGGVTNILLAFPPLLLALTVVSVFTRSWFTVAISIAIVYVPIFIRVTRGPVLALREFGYVRAARSAGVGRTRIMVRHILPNISSVVVVQIALSLSWAVLTEASLSYLGLGTPPPAPSLGSMVLDARSAVSIAPWTMLGPGIVLAMFVLSLNLVGDALRDALDPRANGSRKQ